MLNEASRNAGRSRTCEHGVMCGNSTPSGISQYSRLLYRCQGGAGIFLLLSISATMTHIQNITFFAKVAFRIQPLLQKGYFVGCVAAAYVTGGAAEGLRFFFMPDGSAGRRGACEARTSRGPSSGRACEAAQAQAHRRGTSENASDEGGKGAASAYLITGHYSVIFAA